MNGSLEGFFFGCFLRVSGNYINVKQYNERKNCKLHRCLVGRRKGKVNSSELNIFCRLIKHKAANSILDCKNKINNVFWNGKIMYPGINMNWRVA